MIFVLQEFQIVVAAVASCRAAIVIEIDAAQNSKVFLSFRFPADWNNPVANRRRTLAQQGNQKSKHERGRCQSDGRTYRRSPHIPDSCAPARTSRANIPFDYFRCKGGLRN